MRVSTVCCTSVCGFVKAQAAVRISHLCERKVPFQKLCTCVWVCVCVEFSLNDLFAPLISDAFKTQLALANAARGSFNRDRENKAVCWLFVVARGIFAQDDNAEAYSAQIGPRYFPRM